MKIQTTDLKGEAYISLRSSRLHLKIGLSLEIINLKIDGRDLHLTDKTAACLETNDGCCSRQENFKIPSNPCFLLGKKIKFPAPELDEKNQSESLFSDSELSSSAISVSGLSSKLTWINVTFTQFFSISSYKSIAGFGGRGSFEIVSENTRLESIFLPLSPISISGKQEIVQGNISLKSFSVFDFNPYLIDNFQGFQYSLLVILSKKKFSQI